MTRRVSVETAGNLLDFSGGDAGGVITAQTAAEQLDGAVAIHNLLVDHRVAYLADEVGMGKTYVALGAIALFRHFNPAFRVLVIAPRENIQDKWMREWRNFTRRVIRFDDLRMRGVGGDPARSLVKATSLSDLVTVIGHDHDRDFFARLTSFSLSTSDAHDASEKHRRALLRALPWLNPDLLSLRSKDFYKRNFARAVNAAIPKFDLVVVDEGHNLKGGWRDGKGATRNLVVGCALGGKDPEGARTEGFEGYGPRADRVLFLSATPIEDDFRQLWNQLDLFGLGERWKLLADQSASDEAKRELAREILIRRVGRVRVNGQNLTKNQYRREWRRGGAETHDEPMSLPTDRQKLAVALIQKKVSEVLGDAKNNHSFQVGLLASFESFAQTTRTHESATIFYGGEDVPAGGAQAFYTDSAQTGDSRVREGLDIDAVNLIARDYQKRFGAVLPHPKMDALVQQLATSFRTGRKALVFVRRVASVDELQRKVEEEYDQWIFAKLRREIASPGVMAELESQFRAYHEQRKEQRLDRRAVEESALAGSRSEMPPETSSSDSFFSWFFRGDGPPGVLSGARLAERFDKASGLAATFFEDNYVAGILNVSPPSAFATLARLLGISDDTLEQRLRTAVRQYLPWASRLQRLPTFHAFQHAALDLLVEVEGDVGENARAIKAQMYASDRSLKRTTDAVPSAAEWLGVETLFTRLREEPTLASVLWPRSTAPSATSRFREQELRRMLFATMSRKGHPIIDLFAIVADRVGTLRARQRDTSDDAEQGDLAAQFIDRLKLQAEQPGEFNSYSELAAAAETFQLIITQNAPEARDAALVDVPRLLGRLLGAQRPVGGMAGSVNGVLVKQFRMPGYPLVLVTTDLLQEGEDLHTFCSNVYHYGIAWMPSALEQRVGRIDRVGSQAERRLTSLDQPASGDDKLQVFYPHLRDTVEVIQVRRVLHRLNRFLRLMHDNLGMPDAEQSSIDVKEGMLLPPIDPLPSDQSLVSAFDVRDEMLKSATRRLAVEASSVSARRAAFHDASRKLVAWGATITEYSDGQISGTRRLSGSRVQPFTLLLRSVGGHAVVRCVSPVGRLTRQEFDATRFAKVVTRPLVRISLLFEERIDSYDVAVEGDGVFIDNVDDVVRTIFVAVTEAADAIELEHFEDDPDYTVINTQLALEANVAR
jgi:hypothetical protein